MMYNIYIMKKSLYPQRTQISLSHHLKTTIEDRATIHGESLSEYLRKAAIIRMALDDIEITILKRVATAVIGKIPKHKSGWKDVSSLSLWQQGERHHESEHRP